MHGYVKAENDVEVPTGCCEHCREDPLPRLFEIMYYVELQDGGQHTKRAILLRNMRDYMNGDKPRPPGDAKTSHAWRRVVAALRAPVSQTVARLYGVPIKSRTLKPISPVVSREAAEEQRQIEQLREAGLWEEEKT